MANRRINPERPLTIAERNARVRAKCKALGRCRYCTKQNDSERGYCSFCKLKFSIAAKQKRDSLKRKIFDNYGGIRCACPGCDVTEISFLTLDHYTAHKNDFVNRAGERLYRELRDKNFPPGFRVLCFNCNSGRWINGGECPHATKG